MTTRLPTAALSAAVFVIAAGAAVAQGAPKPAAIPDIRGPDGVFSLLPDGANWSKFQTVRQIGVRCTDKACGGERVFCTIQTRADEQARPGVVLADKTATTFGDGVIASAPKDFATSYVAPFAPKRFGPNLGHWAELKAEGEPGKLRFGLFLVAAKGYDVAFNCVTPSDSWATHQPKIEALLASLKIEQ